MKHHSEILVLLLCILCACTQKSSLIEKTEDKYDVVDGKQELVGQIVKQLRPTDSLTVTKLTKIFNYEDDARIRYLTGFSKKDGLQPYLIDSIFYDQYGNDTMTKSFVRYNNAWKPTLVSYKRYKAGNKIVYFMSERPFQKANYFKKEVNYSYDDAGKLASETETVCKQRNVCDSIMKKEYAYTKDGKLDSTVLYTWVNRTWMKLEKRNGR